MRKELIVDHDPKSALSESIKNIRTNLQFSSVDGKVQNILVTSSTSAEGKSFIAANLAAAFANNNQRARGRHLHRSYCYQTNAARCEY